MKKSIFYLASAALAAGLAACSSDELENASNYTLGEDEFAASIQDATSTRTSIDGTNLRWSAGDEIGLYSDEGEGNYEYGLKNNANGASGVFKRTDKRTETFKAAYAYYPYDADNGKTISDNILGLTLPNVIKYEQAAVSANNYTEVKMPMVGKVSGSNISFQNVTGLIKITVVNMPKTVTEATLTNLDETPIAGAAKFDLTTLDGSEQPALYMSNKSKQYDITYCKALSGSAADKSTVFDSDGGGTFDFYYVIPAGTYDALQFSLGVAGTAQDATFTTKNLKVEANKLYYKTLYYTSDSKGENIALVKGNLGQLNDELAASNGSVSLTADLAEESGNIYIPAGKATDEITLNLTLGAYNATSGSKTITITTTDKTKQTPKVIINANTAADAGADLVLDLPKSAVTLAPLAATTKSEGETEPTVKFAKVSANTYEDVLYISKNVTVSTLVLTATTNAYVQAGATISATTNSASGSYIFCETTDDSNVTVTQSTSTKSDNDTYELYYPKDGKEIPLSKNQENLAKSITISAGKTVTLDLNGYTISTTTGLNAITVDGGTLTIKNSSTAEGALAKTITGASGKAAILVKNGGKVTFSGATISNSGSTAIEVTGEGSSFTLNSGNITGNIVVTTGGSVETKDATSTFGGAVTVSDAASSANIKAASVGAVTANNGTVTINSETTVGAITVAAGTSNITAKTSAGAVSVSGGEATVEAQAEIKEGTTYSLGAISVTGGTLNLTNGTAVTESTVAAGTFNMNGGAINVTTGVALSATNGATVNINGGAIANTSDTSANYALSLDGSAAKVTAKIQSGSVTGNQEAICVKSENATDTKKVVELTISGGKVKSTAADAIVDNTGASTIAVSGGEISATTESKSAFNLTAGSTLTVTGGTISSTKATALSIKKGTLNITSGSPALTAATDVISIATLEAAGDAKVTLSAADAKYTGENVLKDANSADKLPTLSISGGQFTGDVTSTNAKRFIAGGSFKSCDNLRTNYIKFLQEGKKLQYNTTSGYYDVVAE
jgi:hypothetical protein